MTETEGWVREFHAAWRARDVDALLEYFAPDAVIDLGGDPGQPVERQVFLEPGGPMTPSLRAGIGALLASGSHIDVANRQAAETVFGGARATKVAWVFTDTAGPAGLPPRWGMDELVVRAGHVVLYARQVDTAAEARRWEALLAQVGTRRARGALPAGDARRASPTAAAGQARPLSVEDREAAAATSWATAIGLCGLVVALVCRRRLRWG